MRTTIFALICALVGGLAALGIGKATGWVGAGSTTTVFRASPIPLAGAQPAAVGPSAKTPAGNGFDPRPLSTRRPPRETAGRQRLRPAPYLRQPLTRRRHDLRPVRNRRFRRSRPGLGLRRLEVRLHPHELTRAHECG